MVYRNIRILKNNLSEADSQSGPKRSDFILAFKFHLNTTVPTMSYMILIVRQMYLHILFVTITFI